MAAALPLPMRIIAFYCVVCLVSPSAVAQAEPWTGRWASPQCGADATSIILSRSTIDLSTFEAVCTIRSVRNRGSVYDFDTACRFEEDAGDRRTSFSIRIDGDTLTFLKGIGFDPKQFVRCGTGNQRGSGVPTLPRSKPPSEQGQIARGLPLQLGFYVTDGTDCGQASDATLLLVRRNGIGASREFCAFRMLEKIGPIRFRAIEQCASGHAEDVTYDVANDRSYRRKAVGGADYVARYCAQASLPEPWRTNDIRDLIR